MNKSIRGRLAPSPSGYLHIGNLCSLLLAWLDVRALGGGLIFRMEDLDPARSREEYARAMAEDLRWLGLDWDEGYPDARFCQSRRTALYEEAFESLKARELVYPCYCSRAERLAASAPQPGEPGHDPGCRCARLSHKERQALELAGRKPSWKIRVPDRDIRIDDAHYGLFTQNLARDVGDFILRRADGVFAYQLAVTVDVALMGISRVVRGRDLLDSSPRQAWLTELLGAPRPAYAHGPLILFDKRKMSKRLGDLSTARLRTAYSPEELVGELASFLGLIDRPEPLSARELLPHFDWKKITREDIPYENGS